MIIERFAHNANISISWKSALACMRSLYLGDVTPFFLCSYLENSWSDWNENFVRFVWCKDVSSAPGLVPPSWKMAKFLNLHPPFFKMADREPARLKGCRTKYHSQKIHRNRIKRSRDIRKNVLDDVIQDGGLKSCFRHISQTAGPISMIFFWVIFEVKTFQSNRVSFRHLGKWRR